MPARISQSWAAHCQVRLDADVFVAPGPAFAGIILEANPDQIRFHPVINHQMRPRLALWRYHRQGRI